ncbi:MAG: septation protein SpoVG family protein [Planctomycetota bacterium]
MRAAVSALTVSNITFIAGSDADIDSGLLCFVKFTLNDQIAIDGVTLRLTSSGKLTLSFPKRKDRTGNEHPFLYPINATARANIEEQVFARLPRRAAQRR